MTVDIQAELAKAGSILLNRHFVYKSGKHGSDYINMDLLFPNINLLETLGAKLVQPFRRTWSAYDRAAIETVVAPATGGILLAYAAAKAWNIGTSKMPIAAIWADKNGDDFAFERAGFTDHLWHKNTLVVEDVMTTGDSVAKVCREAEKQGAKIIGVSAIANRGGITAEDLSVPRLESLINVSFEAFSPDDCPLCEQEVPIVEDIGHGSGYKMSNPNYKGGYIAILA